MTTPGTYLLHVYLPERAQISVGRLGDVTLRPGSYAYVGSALGSGGLRGRLRRHLRSDADKRRHWHIDSLTAAGDITEIWWVADNKRLECTWSAVLEGVGTYPIQGFGSSDCSCPSHLTFLENTEAVSQAWKTLYKISQGKLKCQQIQELSSRDIENIRESSHETPSTNIYG